MSKSQDTSIAENWIWIEMIFFELHLDVAFVQIRMNHGSLDCPSRWRHRNRYKIDRQEFTLELARDIPKNLFALATERHMHFSCKNSLDSSELKSCQLLANYSRKQDNTTFVSFVKATPQEIRPLAVLLFPTKDQTSLDFSFLSISLLPKYCGHL